MATRNDSVPRVRWLEALEGYRLRVHFDDGTEGVAPLKDRLFGPVFEPLQDVSLFRQVRVDEFGAPCWPNGADLAPDALYEEVKEPRDVSPADGRG